MLSRNSTNGYSGRTRALGYVHMAANELNIALTVR
jgi:hypothetical protein